MAFSGQSVDRRRGLWLGKRPEQAEDRASHVGVLDAAVECQGLEALAPEKTKSFEIALAVIREEVIGMRSDVAHARKSRITLRHNVTLRAPLVKRGAWFLQPGGARAAAPVLASPWTVAAALSAVLWIGVGPASAASLTTVTFVAAATPAIAFSDGSSRLAPLQAGSDRVRRFAARADAVQTRAAEAFVAWGIAERARSVAAVETRSIDMLGPVFGLGTLLGLGTSYDVSVAVLPPRLNADLAERGALGRLGALTGAEFDALYAATEIDALRRLVAVYTDFIKNGDDETLRALAVRELPRVEGLLAQARRL